MPKPLPQVSESVLSLSTSKSIKPNPSSVFLLGTKTEMEDGTAPGPGASREIHISIATPSTFPGFKFSPTDEELISYYLRKKMDGCEKSVEVISELEICRHEPWDLPVIPSENEWFFFSALGRKYPNGSQSRRATELGYWKATGKERNVKSGSFVIGTKRTLVFHVGRAPKGERTEWIMHEYCIDGKSQDAPVICRLRRNAEFRLNGGASASVSQRQLTMMKNSNNVSGVGVGADANDGIMRLLDGEKGVARKDSSSYDSHSVEQLDSASESNQKVAYGAAHAESSSGHKEYDDDDDGEAEDDFYADILRDEIIKLDESSTSATPNVLKMEKSWVDFLSPPTPGPSTMISRRVVFREQQQEQKDQPGSSAPEALEMNNNNNNEYNSDKDNNHHQDWSCSWWSPTSATCLLTASFAGTTIGRQVSAIAVVFALVGLVMFLLGGVR